MQVFGLVIMTGKSYRAERKQFAKTLSETHDKELSVIVDIGKMVEADRDAADKQIERLLHNGLELTLLWAAVQSCGVQDRVRVVYERLSPKEKGAIS